MIAAIVVLSLIPVSVDLGEGRDKIAHFAAYGGLSFWFDMLYRGSMRQFMIALAFAAMGAALEFLQGMTDYRSFEVADMIANAIGAALGWGLAQTRLQDGLAWVERLIPAGKPGDSGNFP